MGCEATSAGSTNTGQHESAKEKSQLGPNNHTPHAPHPNNGDSYDIQYHSEYDWNWLQRWRYRIGRAVWVGTTAFSACSHVGGPGAGGGLGVNFPSGGHGLDSRPRQGDVRFSSKVAVLLPAAVPVALFVRASTMT